MPKLKVVDSLLLLSGMGVTGSSVRSPGRHVPGCALGDPGPRPLVALVPVVPLLQELRLGGSPDQAPRLPLLPGL